MNLKDFKFIKSLGYGHEAEVFLVQYKDGKYYACRREYIAEKDIHNTECAKFKQITFAQSISKLNSLHFLNIHAMEITTNLPINIASPLEINIWYILSEKLSRSAIVKRSKYQLQTIYDLIDGTLDTYYKECKMNKMKISELEEYVILTQLIHAVYYMNFNGFEHNDLYTSNYGFVKTDIKYIDILDQKIPTIGKIWKIIDYGHITYDKKKKPNEISTIIKSFVVSQWSLRGFMRLNNIKVKSLEEYTSILKQSHTYKKLCERLEYSDDWSIHLLFQLCYRRLYIKLITGQYYEHIPNFNCVIDKKDILTILHNLHDPIYILRFLVKKIHDLEEKC